MMAALSGPPIPAKELFIQGHTNVSDSESSDEDDDGIPSRAACISPLKYLPGASSMPTSSRSNLKRSFQTFDRDRRSTYPNTRPDLTFYPGLSKNQKLEHWADTQVARIPLAPLPFHPVHPVHPAHVTVDAPPRSESVDLSAEDDAPEGVLHFLNSALHPTPQVKPEPEPHQPQHIPYPNRQPPCGMSREGEHTHDGVEAGVDLASRWNGKEVDNPSRASETRSSGLRGNQKRRKTKHPGGGPGGNNDVGSGSAGNLEHAPHLSGSTHDNIVEEANLEGDGQAIANNAWGIPDSPEQLDQPEEHGIDTQAHTQRRDSQSTRKPPAANHEEDRNKHLRRSQRIRSTSGQPQQALRSHAHDPQLETVEEDEDQEQQNNDENDNDDNDEDYEDHAEAFDSLEDDGGGGTDIDLSVKESFEEDVIRFRSLPNMGTDGVKDFEGPSDDDVTAIHLDHQPLRQVCKLLAHSAWTGKKVNWEWQPFDCGDAATLPGRTLLAVLVKLERLYEAAPVAPRLKEQNQFLREYSDVLSYYFTRIEVVVDHIRKERLTSKADEEKRKEMTGELVHFIIPMLLRVLASTWGLGGGQSPRTSFTSSTIELLSRSVRWIILLYRPLLRVLEREPLEEEPQQVVEKKSWNTRNEKRQALDVLVKVLLEVVQDAPDRLNEEEKRVAREIEDRRRWLKRQEEKRAQQELEEKARLKPIKEQKLRSLMSMRGVYYPRRSSSSAAAPPPPPPSPPPRAQMSPASSASSSTSFPSPSYEQSQWSFEEKVFLFKKIQDSYPALPNLKSLGLELSKPVEEMESMAEELLGVMLKAVQPEETAENISGEVREIMRDYKLTYGR